MGKHQELMGPPRGAKVATAGLFAGISNYTPLWQRLVK